MEMLAIIMVAIIGLTIWRFKHDRRSLENKKQYLYKRKTSIATSAELAFYSMLRNIIEENCVIIPQAHLSSFLDEHTYGQNWRGAFFAINGKSVDFLICNKSTLSPLYAIELDDWTHNKKDRMERDKLVNEILEKSNIHLIRFRAGEWKTQEMIFNKIKSQTNSLVHDKQHYNQTHTS